MAETQKSVYIRFNMDDKNDKELYHKLMGEAGGSASLTAYVKRVLEEYFTLNIKIADRQEFHNQMLSVVREEMQSQGMKLVGALLAGIGTVSISVPQTEADSKEVELPSMSYTRQSLEILDIDVAKDISWRQKLKDSFDLAVKIIGDSQEKAWRNMTGSCPNTFEYITEAIQEDIIKGIVSLAKENKCVATKDNNTKLFDIANQKLASYMMNDTLVMVEDEGLIGHDFKSGFAIGYDKVYIARNTKKGEIYAMPFENIEKLRPNEGKGKFDIDKWFINIGSDYELNYIGLTRAKDMALIIGLIIIRSYIVNGSEYILKIDH